MGVGQKWEAYFTEISRAKDEYDGRINPIITLLENTHREAWDAYILRIKNAETLIKEEGI